MVYTLLHRKASFRIRLEKSANDRLDPAFFQRGTFSGRAGEVIVSDYLRIENVECKVRIFPVYLCNDGESRILLFLEFWHIFLEDEEKINIRRKRRNSIFVIYNNDSIDR